MIGEDRMGDEGERKVIEAAVFIEAA